MKAQYLVISIVATFVFLGCAIEPKGQETELPEQPPDTRSYSRPLIPEDLAVARRKPLPAVPAPAVPHVSLVRLVDVNTIDSRSGSEPSLAVDPENPNRIVVHGGFRDWGPTGQANASLYVTTNGGVTWSRVASIDPPTNQPACNPSTLLCGPNDVTVAYGANSVLFGSVLGEGDIFTGITTDPNTIASFRWRTILDGVIFTTAQAAAFVGKGPIITPFERAQPTERIATHNNDQPWVVVLSHRPDPIILGGLADFRLPLPIAMQNDVYVAYSDFSDGRCTALVPVRVAVSPHGANPPNFTIDKQVGTRGGGTNCVSPGHRLAVAPTTIFRDGTVGKGFVYSLHQHCANCSANPPLFDIVLNRTMDRGATWSVNGDPAGMVVAEAASEQPRPKFGTVNALLGGLDQLAVDPGNGLIYVVYGVFDPAVRHNRLAMRRLFYVKCSEFFSCNWLVADPPVFVDDGQAPAALPSVAVTANGTVGVLYDTFEGMTAGLPVFTVHLAVAAGRQGGLSFANHSLLAFLSPASDNSDSGQRVLGDYQQMIAVGDRLYGVFTGTGVPFGRSVVSQDPIVFIADVSSPAPSTTGPLTDGPTANAPSPSMLAPEK